MPRSYLTRKHWRCLTWEKQPRRQPSPPPGMKQNFLHTPPNRDAETKSLTSSTEQVVEIKLLRAKPHVKIQNTRDQVGERSTTYVKGKSLTSLISKELLKMETILLTKTQKTGKRQASSSWQLLWKHTTRFTCLLSLTQFEETWIIVKLAKPIQYCKVKKNNNNNNKENEKITMIQAVQPPHLQAFLLHPFFCGQNTWEPPSLHTSKCTDRVIVWRRHAAQRVSGTLPSRVMGELIVWQSFRSYTWRHLSTASPAMACRALGPHVGPRLLSWFRSLLWCGCCLLCLTCPVTQLGALPPSCSDLGCFSSIAKSCLTLLPPHGL